MSPENPAARPDFTLRLAESHLPHLWSLVFGLRVLRLALGLKDDALCKRLHENGDVSLTMLSRDWCQSAGVPPRVLRDKVLPFIAGDEKARALMQVRSSGHKVTIRVRRAALDALSPPEGYSTPLDPRQALRPGWFPLLASVAGGDYSLALLVHALRGKYQGLKKRVKGDRIFFTHAEMAAFTPLSEYQVMEALKAARLRPELEAMFKTEVETLGYTRKDGSGDFVSRTTIWMDCAAFDNLSRNGAGGDDAVLAYTAKRGKGCSMKMPRTPKKLVDLQCPVKVAKKVPATKPKALPANVVDFVAAKAKAEGKPMGDPSPETLDALTKLATGA